MVTRPIAYEPHPVSPARKAELTGQGYKILDEVFKPADEAPAPAPAPKRAGKRAPETDQEA